MTLDGNILKSQAIKFGSMFQETECKASCGWLDGFKKRNNITLKTSVGEAGFVDSKIIKNYLNVVLPDLIKDYEPRNIFNADETGLYYKAMPNKTMYYKNLACNKV